WFWLPASDLPRVRLARRTLGLDLLGRLPDENKRTLGAGHAALHHQQVPLGVHSYHLVGPFGRPHVAHLSRHAHALEDARGVGGADRARLADVHGAVALGPAAEAVALDQTLEALPLGGGGHVDQVAFAEEVGFELLSNLEAVVVADLDHVAQGIDAGLLEAARHRLGDALGVDLAEPDLGRRVTVLLDGAQADHAAGPRLQDGDRRDRSVG